MSWFLAHPKMPADSLPREPRLTATAAEAKAPAHGPFDVERDSFYVGGLVAKGSQNAGIWYPVGTPPQGGFPVVTFAHGAPVGGQLLLSAT